MNEAHQLFDKLKAFKETPSPETEFLKYCKQTLGIVEPLHFDYKEKQDTSNGKLDDSDRRNLAKAVSGFANSSGGVLIWGIKDQNLKENPVTQVESFLQALLELAPQATEPPVQGIDGTWIPSTSGSGDTGYALIHIPESVLPPHRVTLKIAKVQNHYFIRSGSSFVSAPHVQLEDMFGRRPKPKLVLSVLEPRSTGQQFRVSLQLENQGRGIAKSPAVFIRLLPGMRTDPYPGATLSQRSSDLFEPHGKVAISNMDTGVIHSGLDVRLAILIFEREHWRTGQSVQLEYRAFAEGLQPITQTFEFSLPTISS